MRGPHCGIEVVSWGPAINQILLGVEGEGEVRRRGVGGGGGKGRRKGEEEGGVGKITGFPRQLMTPSCRPDTPQTVDCDDNEKV